MLVTILASGFPYLSVHLLWFPFPFCMSVGNVDLFTVHFFNLLVQCNSETGTGSINTENFNWQAGNIIFSCVKDNNTTMPFFPGNSLLFEQQQSLNPFEVKAAVMLKRHFKNDSRDTLRVFLNIRNNNLWRERTYLETRKKITLTRADVMRQC